MKKKKFGEDYDMAQLGIYNPKRIDQKSMDELGK